jgi:hypothetical protein
MVMTGQGATSAHEAVPDRVSVWRWLSIAAAVLAVAGSVTALYVDSIYARLMPTFLPMALAQDIANLALASPALLILAAVALRNCLRARLVWLGVLTFTACKYVIYTFSVPSGPLFLLWVAVLGLCVCALIDGIAATDHGAVEARFASRRVILAAETKVVAAARLKSGQSCR